MKNKNSTQPIVKVCIGLVLLYIFLGTQNLIPLPAPVTDLLLILAVLACSMMEGWRLRLKTDKPFWFSIRHFVVPALLIFVYSMINQLARGLSWDYLQNTITTVVRHTVYYLVGILAVRVFGSRTVDCMLVTGVLAYIPAFIKHFQQYGVWGGLKILVNPDIFHLQTPLEIHTMTYIFGFMALYYAYRWFVTKDRKAKWWFFASVLLTVIGTKRIILAALVLSVALLLVLKKICPRQRYSLMRIGCFALIGIAFLFVAMIHSGLLEKLANALGVESSSRFMLWGLLEDKYTMKPTFLGYGMSYGARIMHYVWQDAGLNHMVALHSDILRVYVGLGFVGFGLYWYNYFYATMRTARRTGSIDAATFVFIIAVYYFINSMTSNEGLNPMTHGMYFTIIYAVLFFECQKDPGFQPADCVICKGEKIERTSEEST